MALPVAAAAAAVARVQVTFWRRHAALLSGARGGSTGTRWSFVVMKDTAY